MISMDQIKTVCVYCGSGAGSSPRFVEAALALGKVAEARVGALIDATSALTCTAGTHPG